MYYYIKPGLVQSPKRKDGTRGYPKNKALGKNLSATSDRTKWILFTQEEKEHIELLNIRPYGAKFDGVFSEYIF